MHKNYEKMMRFGCLDSKVNKLKYYLTVINIYIYMERDSSFKSLLDNYLILTR